MRIPGLLRKYLRIWKDRKRDRAWDRSARKQKIDAERDLPPRPLTRDEETLLRTVLEHGTEVARSFLPQLEGLRAVRACTCGCPSIQLIVSVNAPLGHAQGDSLIADHIGRTTRGELVGLMVLQSADRICELEVYSLDGELETMEFGLPTIESLEPLQISTSE